MFVKFDKLGDWSKDSLIFFSLIFFVVWLFGIRHCLLVVGYKKKKLRSRQPSNVSITTTLEDEGGYLSTSLSCLVDK